MATLTLTSGQLAGSASMRAIAGCVFILIVIVLSFFMLRAAAQHNRRSREELYKTFENTLQQHEIRTFEILKESVWIRNGIHQSELYRILLADTGHYFLYFQATGTQPIFIPLTEKRAIQASEGKIGIQA